jgi:hypothetical protein
MRRKPVYDVQRGDWSAVRRGAWQFMKFDRVWITSSDYRPCRWLETRAERSKHVKRTHLKRVNRNDYNYLELRES